MAEYSDVSVNLRPELLKAIHFIFRDQCNLQPGWRVLIICDSHTPQHVSTAFNGVAMQFGAQVAELRVPMAPHPAYQPGFTWDPLISRTVLAAADFGAKAARLAGVLPALERRVGLGDAVTGRDPYADARGCGRDFVERDVDASSRAMEVAHAGDAVAHTLDQCGGNRTVDVVRR